MMKNAGSDAKRQLLPPPPGRGPIPKNEGLSTFLRLTDKTGLTKTAKNGNVTIPDNRSPVPGIARIFNAVPGVENKDFVQPWRQLLVRK